MRDELISILIDLKDNIDYENQQSLIDDDIIDSLTLTRLIMEMEEAFDIEIEMEDLIPENFNSIDAMVDLISRLK